MRMRDSIVYPLSKRERIGLRIGTAIVLALSVVALLACWAATG